MQSVISRRRGGIVLLLAASLTAAYAAGAVEPPGNADAAGASANESKKELDARLEEAQRRLNQAASEVAALSAEIAGNVVESITRSFGENPRRTVIGVQLEPDGNGMGARVKDVSPGGPADEAGMRAGDVIVAVNGKEVKGEPVREVVRLLRDVPPNSKARVRVLREGTAKEFEVIPRPFDPRTFVYRTDPPPDFNFDLPRGPLGPFNYRYGTRGEIEGMEITTLTPQLGRYFGTDKGVLVLRAPTSDVLKLRDGDVILAIDGRVPTSSSHAIRILSSYQAGEKLTMHVMRDRKTLNLEVALPGDARERRTRAGRPDRRTAPL